MSYRPFTEQIGESSPEKFDGPHKGVPPWLRPSLCDWIERVTPKKRISSTTGGQHQPHMWVLRQLEREAKLDPLTGRAPRARLKSLLTTCSIDEGLCLDVVHWFLQQEFVSAEQARDVDKYLREAGSAYAVNGLEGGLGVRVNDEATAAAKQAASSDERAGHHLKKAWTATYGRGPKPGLAYSEAVKAVEAAAQPVITPDDEKATLGKMIQAITDKPEKWSFTISSRDGASRMKSVGDMMAVLWQGQLRHGTPEPAAPFDNSQPEAEAAVHLSVTLVAWFAQGSISVVEAGR